MTRRLAAALCGTLALLAVPVRLAGQFSFHGRGTIGRAEHRVLDAGASVVSSGTLLGGALGFVGGEWEVWAEVMGGRLAAADSPAMEDREIAEVALLASVRVRPWLRLRGGPWVRSYFNTLARQRWTMLRFGAEARVPLAVESVRVVLRGDWMPIANVSGLQRPEIAFAAGVGLEWRRKRIGVSTLYTLERYDFPANAGGRRLEEFAALQIRTSVRWR